MPAPLNKVDRAELYRTAAEKALIYGLGWSYLRKKGISPFEVFDWLGPDRDQRCIALCLIAAMVEAGDA